MIKRPCSTSCKVDTIFVANFCLWLSHYYYIGTLVCTHCNRLRREHHLFRCLSRDGKQGRGGELSCRRRRRRGKIISKWCFHRPCPEREMHCGGSCKSGERSSSACAKREKHKRWMEARNSSKSRQSASNEALQLCRQVSSPISTLRNTGSSEVFFSAHQTLFPAWS